MEDVKKYDLDVESQKKGYLSFGSISAFLTVVRSKEERGPMLAQLERALLRGGSSSAGVSSSGCPRGILEKLISENRYARVRGKGSDRETVWPLVRPEGTNVLAKKFLFS